MEIAETKEYLDQLIKEYLSLLWRQKLWFFGVLLGGIAVTLFVVVFLPRVYRSSALLIVEGQKISEDFAKSAAATTIISAATRFSQFREQILSRTLLQKVIDKFGLDKSEYEGQSLEDSIESMRKNIEVKTVGRRTVDAFSIAYSSGNPLTTMNVTNELAVRAAETNVELRRGMVEKTKEFMNAELKVVQDALERQESKIATFRQTYMGMLPNQFIDNAREALRLRQELQSIQVLKRTASERKAALEDLVRGAEGRSVGRDASPMVRLGSLLGMPLLSLSQRDLPPVVSVLIDKTIELEKLQSEYTSEYPDIPLLQKQIAALEAQLPAVQGAYLRESEIDIAGREIRPVEPLSHIQVVKIALSGLDEQEKGSLNSLREYQNRIDNSAVVEQELGALQRVYDTLQKEHDVLAEKKQAANMSENVETEQTGERFRIIDYASLPETPIKPKPSKILLVGFSLSLAGAVGIAFVRDKFDRTIRKPIELERIMGVPVLAYIPDFTRENPTPYKYMGDKVLGKGASK